jgi:hypothetical protein
MNRYVICCMLLLGCIFPSQASTQCTVLDAGPCVCKTPGQTACDLLPDITSSWYGLLYHSTSLGTGPKEYAQSGNGANDGRLRISLSTPNIGHGSLTVRGVDDQGNRWFVCGTDTFSVYDPNSSQAFSCPNGGQAKQLIFQRIYQKSAGTMTYYDRFSGTMTYHPTHGHNHVDDWGIYTLRLEDPNDPNPLNWPIIGNGAKIGFCLMDYGSCSFYNHHCKDTNTHVNQGATMINSMFPNYGLGGVSVNQSYNCSQFQQGISVGWTDIYGSHLDGMWIDIPPGTCNGNYWIVAESDPLNAFLEEDETNNWTAVPVTLTLQSAPGDFSGFSITPDRPPVLCSNQSMTLSATPGFSYLWNTGDTTRSIQIQQPGPYVCTITNYCGTAQTDTLWVQVQTPPSPPIAVQPSPVCAQQTVSLQASGAQLEWFNASGQWLGSGNNITSPSLSQSTFYTVVQSFPLSDTLSVGMPNIGVGSGGFSNADQGLLFDVFAPMVLNKLTIYANSNGNRSIRVYDGIGGLVKDTVVALTTGQNIIQLQLALPIGNDYVIRLNTNANCFRHAGGVQFPYTIPGTLSIKNSTAGSGYYYWFYDWEVITQPQACFSAPDTVWAQVHPPVPIQFMFSGQVPLGTTSMNLSALPAGGMFSGLGVNGNTIDFTAWSPGQTEWITYTYMDMNGCTHVDSMAMTTSITGLESAATMMPLALFPQPANQKVTLVLPTGFKNQRLSLWIRDASGRQVEVVEAIPDTKGEIQISVVHIPTGCYFLEGQGAGQKFCLPLLINKP